MSFIAYLLSYRTSKERAALENLDVSIMELNERLGRTLLRIGWHDARSLVLDAEIESLKVRIHYSKLYDTLTPSWRRQWDLLLQYRTQARASAAYQAGADVDVSSERHFKEDLIDLSNFVETRLPA